MKLPAAPFTRMSRSAEAPQRCRATTAVDLVGLADIAGNRASRAHAERRDVDRPSTARCSAFRLLIATSQPADAKRQRNAATDAGAAAS